MEAVNNNASEKPIFKCGAFKWLNQEEAECLLCSKPGKPKALKTAKNSISTLVNHLKYHPTAKAKYEELLANPNKITRYIPNHVG